VATWAIREQVPGLLKSTVIANTVHTPGVDVLTDLAPSPPVVTLTVALLPTRAADGRPVIVGALNWLERCTDWVRVDEVEVAKFPSLT
jgi:hypothetical protein